MQRILSPELKIAFDLYVAPTCGAKVDLLPLAQRDGDERAVAVLMLQTAPTKRGCGPRRNKPCPPPCAKEAPQIEQAVKAIRARLAEAKPG